MVVGRVTVRDVSLPRFGQLVDILAYGSPVTVIFVFKRCRTVRYNKHYAAYEIDIDSHSDDYFCCFAMSMHYRYLLTHSQIGSLHLIKSKYDLGLYE
jgi:hypothetical protein